MATPLLSICLITYNQVNFIKQAIESVLTQKVNFKWELIIADDYSSDGTREILLEYKEKYPQLIKLILQKKNGRQTMIKNKILNKKYLNFLCLYLLNQYI